MMQPSNTPPDGDFARYVERLTAAQAVLRKTAASPAAPSTAAASPLAMAGLQAVTRIPFLRHLKWLAVLWVGTQLLAKVLPGAGMLFIPLLVAYAAWVLYGLRRDRPAALTTEWGALARRAAGAAQTSRWEPTTTPKNKA